MSLKHVTDLYEAAYLVTEGYRIEEVECIPISRTLACRISFRDEGEIEKAIRCIADGKLERDVTRHEETRQMLAWMDQIRRELEVRYPFEAGAKL